MQPLNFPQYKFRIRKTQMYSEIYDKTRRKWVRLTPEELVRQNMVQMLISEFNYPAGCIANEVSVPVNGMNKRCDSVVFGYDRSPRIVIEYKAPTVPITQDIFNQVLTYNTSLNVPFIIVSNGLSHVYCDITNPASVKFLPCPPAYDSFK